MIKNTINHLSGKKNNNTKSIKPSKIITYQTKTFENPNIVDIKSSLQNIQTNSHKLSKIIRQAAKVGYNSPLYRDTKKRNIF